MVPPMFTLISVPKPCMVLSPNVPSLFLGISYCEAETPAFKFSVTMEFWAWEKFNARMKNADNRKPFLNIYPELRARVLGI